MRIVQLTDLHIAKIGEKTILDIDVWGKFQRVLAKAKKMRPDLLVVSGDLCYQSGEKNIYQWVKNELDQSDIQYLVIAGNHDDSALMATIFGLPLQEKTEECYYAKDFESGKILFLDSAKATFSERQWKWLEGELAIDVPILIFIHHPPVLAQAPFMDENYSFKEMERFAEALTQNSNIIPVFCGHYHTERFVQSKHFNVFITPSTMAQIDAENPEYALEHLTPGFRVIDWGGEHVNTFIEYLWG